jgi:hypothetical protein
MTTTLNASTAGAGGFIATSDNSGVLALQTAGTTAVTIDTSQNLSFNSGYGSVATAYGCRAWVNFNGVSSITVRGSANVSSVTRSGTGNYTVNFTNAMPDVNYATVTSAWYPGSSSAFTGVNSSTTSSVNLNLSSGSGSNTDASQMNVAIIR